MRFLAAIILCIHGSLFAQPSELDNAEQLASQSKYPEALSAFNSVIAREPGNVEAYVGRGHVYQQLGLSDKAITDYSIAVSLHPNHWDARFARAVLWFHANRLKESLQDFQFLLTEPLPETNRIYYRKSAHSQGFDQVTTSQSEGFIAQIHNYVGLIYTLLKEYTPARLAFDKAIQLDPLAADYFVNRALLKQAVNDSTFQQDFEYASRLNPNHALVSAHKAMMQENASESERLMTEAIAKDSLMVHNYMQRGYLRLGKKDYNGALNDFDQAIAMRRNDAELWLNRGVVKVHLNDNAGSIRDFTQAIELKPDYEKAWLNRGNTFAKLGDYEKAIEDYSVAITYYPEYAAAFYNRALAFYKLKKITEACSDLERTSKLGLNVDSIRKQICK